MAANVKFVIRPIINKHLGLVTMEEDEEKDKRAEKIKIHEGKKQFVILTIFRYLANWYVWIFL